MKRISIANPVFNGNEKKYLMECIDTGWVSANGRFVSEFEDKFAHECGMRHALSCANGTVSLHLALRGLGIGPGDEVIMPTLTYIATANCVAYCGAKPVFADSEEGTFNIDPSDIEPRITPCTKAIMPVHLYGLPCRMREIERIAKEHGLHIIEDAAEAVGARIGTRKAGSFGVVSSFSFFGNKVITCGEGGMVVTNDDELYNRMKLLKGQGMSATKRYWHEVVGYNYRMTNMQAAVGLGQLENLEWHVARRRCVAGWYEKRLCGLSDLARLQRAPEGYTSVCWMNSVILQDGVKKERDQVMQELEECGIETRPVFYPMHIMPPYLDPAASCPVAERLASRGISLPSHAMLSEEDVAYVCGCLAKAIQS